MKATKLTCLIASVCLLPAAPLYAAEVFNSGSNGSYGEMNITTDTTLDMPPDGIFHCTTITVAQGATLKFNKNPLNTPVYLLATGDVVLNGKIDVSGSSNNGGTPGRGGPGGFDGGFAAFSGFPDGDGQGPGGGGYSSDGDRLGGAYAVASSSNTNVYGNTLLTELSILGQVFEKFEEAARGFVRKSMNSGW